MDGEEEPNANLRESSSERQAQSMDGEEEANANLRESSSERQAQSMDGEEEANANLRESSSERQAQSMDGEEEANANLRESSSERQAQSMDGEEEANANLRESSSERQAQSMDGEEEANANLRESSSELRRIRTAFFIFMEDFTKNHSQNQNQNFTDALKAATLRWCSLSIYARLCYFAAAFMYSESNYKEHLFWPEEEDEETDDKIDEEVDENSALTPFLIFLAMEFRTSSDIDISMIETKWQYLTERQKKPYYLLASKRLAEYEENHINSQPLPDDSPVATGLTTFLSENNIAHDVRSFVERWTSLSSAERMPFFIKADKKMKIYEDRCLTFLKTEYGVSLFPRNSSMVKRLHNSGIFG
ncbi:PREDICTED: uncharacterized protein LOC104756648 isoform X2 [Camelina sativa]|uniref:Uncharacterized protein LOC104756648 isoform X2 n=1 Tax=Camelina sativa TaxID=90675 RepID=A0ABM1R5I2_CAMSA|nr:PREDICTED: uncharacterized protein LOC104756648 isoform X2 [Camelina sativa]